MAAGLAYLILSIISTTCINLILKGYGKYGVNTFRAITINYFVCSFSGAIALGQFPIKYGCWNEIWFPYALALAFLFVVGFNIVAKTVRIFGVTVGSVVQKMSLVLTVTFAILYFKEEVNAIKIVGVILALLAVVLTNYPSKEEGTVTSPELLKRFYYFIILTFLIDATISIALQYIELRVAPQGNDPSFLISLFFFAGMIGALYWLYHLLQGRMKPTKKDFIGGLVLGLPNFASLYFLMLALGQPGWEGSVVYPIVNVAIIALSAIMAFLIFKEKLSTLNKWGVMVAVFAIVAVGFSVQILEIFGMG